MKQINIAVDGRVLIREPRGISNFLLNAILAMNIDGRFSIKIFTHMPLCESVTNKLSHCKNVEIIIVPLKIIPNIGFLWFLFYLPLLINKLKPDFYWACAVIYPWGISSKIKKISTVHDMVIHDYRNTMDLKSKLFLLCFHDHSIKKADILWAVSSYTKKLIEKKFPKRKSKEIFVGSSIDLNFFHPISITTEEKKQFLYKMKINNKFLLFVGTLAPRKNLKFLLKFIPTFFNKNGEYQLVVVGGKGWGRTEISDIIKKKDYPIDKIIFTGYVSNENLVILYNLASCFISTSLNEGFGLPQLEALACGCPVVTANNSAMTEVVNDMGVLVDGWDYQNWYEGIIKGIYSQSKMNNVVQQIHSKYSWQKIIDNLYKRLQEIT